MLLETLRARVYCKGLGLWLMSGVSLPHAASSLQLIPAINPVSPPFLGRYPYFSDPNNSDTDGDLLSDGNERGYGRYVAVKGQFNWEEAVINASEMGGSLATFDTEGHWRIALDTLGAKGLNDFIGVWIGAQKNEVSQKWEWVNGDKFNFDKWGPNQPLSLGGSGKAAVSGGFGSSPYLWEEVPTRGVRDGHLMFIGYLTDPSISDTDGDGWND